MADPFKFDHPKRYAVMGHPVSHSKSPLIHKQFAHQFKHNLEYTAIDVDPGGIAQAVEQYRANGGKGLNVTVPFKQDAYKLADNLSDRAKHAGAVNTLMFESDGRVFGDNTDGTGLVHDLIHNLGVPIKDKSVLVMGAGGAVRGVLGPLLKQHPKLVVVANRTVGRAKELAEVFDHYGKLKACGYEDLKGHRFDIVINGTSASLQDEVPSLPASLFARNALAYDMMYGDRPTAFMIWAEHHGAETVSDGLGMLVEQAAESYFVWHGVRPDTKPVITELRKQG
jgi:shikimate dehydrogenase